MPGDSTRYDGSASPDRTVPVTDPVVAKPTTTTLATSASGRTATLTATVTAASGTPQGTVQLRDGAVVIGTVTLAGGTALFQATDLLRGTHRFTAEFVPADSSAFVASQSAESVVDIAATPTTTSLTASSTPARSVTLQAAVTAGVGGTVRFTEGATVLGTVAVSGGSASLTVTDVPAGTHTWTAAFTPADDLRWAPSSGQRVADVAATPTSTALGSSIAFHQVTLSATVSSVAGAPAGTVEFREGSTLVATRTLSSGTASAVLPDVSTGSHSWTATFVPASPTSYAARPPPCTPPPCRRPRPPPPCSPPRADARSPCPRRRPRRAARSPGTWSSARGQRGRHHAGGTGLVGADADVCRTRQPLLHRHVRAVRHDARRLVSPTRSSRSRSVPPRRSRPPRPGVT